jgi:hypothetical protein
MGEIKLEEVVSSQREEKQKEKAQHVKNFLKQLDSVSVDLRFMVIHTFI